MNRSNSNNGVSNESRPISTNPKYTRLKESNNVYIHEDFRGESLVSDDEQEEIELYSIRHRGKSKKDTSKSKSPNRLSTLSECVIHTIKEGETLERISLLYEVPIGEIKRVNNIISNQEFFGLQTLKIPTKKYGLLLDILPTEKPSSQTRSISIGQFLQSEDDEATNFLKRMDQDLARIRDATKLNKDSLDEVTCTLTSPNIQPLVSPPTESYNCGLQWQVLVIFLFLICVIAPLISIAYLAFNKHTFSNKSTS